MVSLDRLCAWIDLPREVVAEVAARAGTDETRDALALLPLLHERMRWSEGLDAIGRLLGDDPQGWGVLTVMLIDAARRHDDYRRLGLGDDVYVATMAFCTRFVREHRAVHGGYAFTWASWFVRQLSLLEFRVGALEYEFVDQDDADAIIRLHVPADAALDRVSLRDSWSRARRVLPLVRPDADRLEMRCDSWLLSPRLEDLLPPTSRIREFRDGFDGFRFAEADRSARRWLFGRDDEPTELLAERTSLQRAVKRTLLSGVEIGAADARLRSDPWT